MAVMNGFLMFRPCLCANVDLIQGVRHTSVFLKVRTLPRQDCRENQVAPQVRNVDARSEADLKD